MSQSSGTVVEFGRVLVTGASGFVGRHMVTQLLEYAPEARVLAWQRGGDAQGQQPAPHPRVQWRTVDVLRGDQVQEAISADRPDAIVHLAGAAHVGNSWRNPVTPLEVNVLGTHQLLEACRHAGLAPRLVVSGSAAVYKPSGDVLSETSPLGPVSPYGLSKLAQEELCRLAHRHDGVPALVTRSFNHIGPGQGAGFFASAFARQVAQIEARLVAPTLTVGNLEARRDLMDVRDTVGAYFSLLQAGVAGECYNVCSGHAYQVGDVLERLIRRATCHIDIAVDPDKLRPNDVPLVLGSAARLTADTGWVPRHALDESLEAVLGWWRAEVARGAAHALP